MDGTGSSAPIEHIFIDEKGRPCLKNSRFKIVQLVSNMLGQGWSPEQAQEQYPDLSLGEIYAALVYYCDHKEAMDVEMRELDKDFDRRRAQTLNSPLRQKLRAMGKLP
jgi:uncharacterized protein (DUF433 family)